MGSRKGWGRAVAVGASFLALEASLPELRTRTREVQQSGLSAREYPCAQPPQTLPPGDPQTQSEARQIARKSSISKAIDLAGFAMLEMPLPHNEAAELEHFAQASHVIVSGVVSNRRCSVTADDRWVVSAYPFKTDQVFKGPVSVGQELTVIVLGGGVTFADGTWAQVIFDRLVMPSAGERYFLFLRRSDTALGTALAKRVGPEGAYQMTQLGPGAFKLDPNGIARSVVNTQGRVRFGKNLIQTYDGQSIERLLADLRAVLGK